MLLQFTVITLEVVDMQNQITLAFLAFIVQYNGSAWSYSGGAPVSVCNSMTPGHGKGAQTSTVPFELAPDNQIIESEQIIILTLSSSTESTAFKGFIVQAFESGTDNNIGSFIIDSSSSTM